MEATNHLLTFLVVATFLSFLFSIHILKLNVLSIFDLRTLFRRDKKEKEIPKSLYPSKIIIAFRFARLLSNTTFIATFIWLMATRYELFTRLYLLGATVLSSFLFLWVMNSLVPHLWISRLGHSVSKAGIQFSKAIFWIMYPFVWLTSYVSKEIDENELGGDDKVKAAEFEEEMNSLLEEGEKKGIFAANERSLFRSLVEFSDTVVREVMTPRLDIVAVEEEEPLDNLLEKIINYGFTRIPIYKERIDNITGVVFAKDLLLHWGKADKNIDLTELMREAYFVPETKKITQMLKDFQKNKNHMAIVVDEYGGVSGVVTIEDLLEEIVGEIRDEYDNEVDMMQILDDKSLKVDARLNVEEIEDYFNVSIEREDFDTVGGLIFHILGRVPKEGEVIELNELRMKILSAEERRVRTIHISPTEKYNEELQAIDD